MKIATSLFFLIFLFSKLFSFSITQEDARIIGDKIWQNECAGTVEGLTNWKKGETFASLGIGHFIWYPSGKKERFEETFPSLVSYLQKKGVLIPDWLQANKGCPWSSREKFYQEIQSVKMQELRKLLLETKDLQALFIAKRLEETLQKLLINCQEKGKVAAIFSKLLKSKQGLYALIDYLNFKGSGTSPLERYKGQGWGLLQVLEHIPSLSETPVVDFVKAAKAVLIQRVKNAPPERQEDKWLKGWLNRVDTYTRL